MLHGGIPQHLNTFNLIVFEKIQTLNIDTRCHFVVYLLKRSRDLVEYVTEMQ